MTITTIIILLLIGLAAGMLSGLIGVGGGVIIVPALTFFLAFTQQRAQGTSLGILLLPVGILSVIQYYKQGYIDVKVVAVISLAFLVGGYLGSKIALSLSQATLKKIFAIILIAIALKILIFDRDTDKKEPEKINSTT